MSLYTGYIFDQDGTIYPSSNDLWTLLSTRTQEWMCKQKTMLFDDFTFFKRQYPVFTDWLTALWLSLSDWHREVQEFMLEDICSLLQPDYKLQSCLAQMNNCYLVTYSSENFANKVLYALWVHEYFDVVYSVVTPDKWDIYLKIKNTLSVDSSELLVIWDNVIADLEPAIKLWMHTHHLSWDENIWEYLTSLLV